MKHFWRFQLEFEYSLFLGPIAFLLGLLYIYIAPAKKFELKFIDNIPIATIYTNYFFLPLTTKITEYKNIQKAYVQETGFIMRGWYIIYSIFLKFPKTTKEILSNANKNYLLKECKKINDAISSCKEYSISKNDNISRVVAVFIIFSVLSLLLVSSNFKDIEAAFCLGSIAFVSLIMFSICIVLSLLVNFYKKRDSKNYNIYETDTYYNRDNIKEKVNIDSEAKRINDSIIK